MGFKQPVQACKSAPFPTVRHVKVMKQSGKWQTHERTDTWTSIYFVTGT